VINESRFCTYDLGDRFCGCLRVSHEDGALGHVFEYIDLDGAPVDPQEEKKERCPSLDWDELMNEDFSNIDWLPGRFMEHGQQVALVGDGKVGKTLVIFDWLVRCISGKPFLGYAYDRPLKVLYFDRENGRRDIATRMKSLGASVDDLKVNFDYRMFPGLDPLDTNQVAVLEFLRIVDESKPDIVIIDTVSRFITGNENEANTWLAFYRNIHAPLKARGVSCVRLDHFGKDAERGSRGNSAKSQDVDHVWEITRTADAKHTRQGSNNEIEMIVTNLRLKRTHTRTGLGEDTIHIVRRAHKDARGVWMEDGTRHELMDAEVGQRLQQVLRAELKVHVDVLIAKGVPSGLGRDALVEWCRKKRYKLPGKTSDQTEITKAIKVYYELNPPLEEDD
jgi:hypothetical protein